MVALLHMFLPVSTVAVLCVLIDISDGFPRDNELAMIFKDRTKSEWEEAWHREKYVRCRDTLMSHLYWACEKDIYRITRRSKLAPKPIESEIDLPWISKMRAQIFLRNRRGYSLRSGSSITAECCRSKGCTWEEYAEYCPNNKRYV